MTGIFTGYKTWNDGGRVVFLIFFKLEQGGSGRVYTQKSFGNYKRTWADFILKAKKGDVVTGLTWQAEHKKILDGDSRITLLERKYV